MSNINILHLTSTMLPGGAERVAINILNNLEINNFTPFLATSRHDGPLLANLSNNIIRTCLGRKFRFDLCGLLRFIKFIKHYNIQIIHAHENTIFVALISKLFVPGIIIIWHNHMSSLLRQNRPGLSYLLAGRAADMIVVANTDLEKWTIEKMKISGHKVRYIPNFVDTKYFQNDFMKETNIPDISKNCKRIICVGNIKPEKDQITLINAFEIVVRSIQNAHLILVGNIADKKYSVLVDEEIQRLRIENHISILGARDDIPVLLTKCDIGILSSKNEAFPMTLIEYGYAKLPAIATNVGQCPEILDYGNAGVLVEPNNPDQLAMALIQLLKSKKQMNDFGQNLYDRVINFYSAEKVMWHYKDLYIKLLKNKGQE